jgi:hypothetical protein
MSHETAVNTNLPVLLLIFNRPEAVRRSITALKKTAPPRIYISADGPRTHRPGEIELVRRTREVLDEAIDWPCQIQKRFSNENLGCARSVIEGITWFFEKEECGVILEDDCIPLTDFFRFSEALLQRYRDDTRIWTISGTQALRPPPRLSASYRASIYFHSWGWASWRRVWQQFPKDLDQICNEFRTFDLSALSDGNALFSTYWRTIAQMVHRKKFDSWAYPFLFHSFMRSGRHLHPATNLIENIGFDEKATHTVDPTSAIPTSDLSFPLCHPSSLVLDSELDQELGKQHYHIEPRFLLGLKFPRIKQLLNRARGRRIR